MKITVKLLGLALAVMALLGCSGGKSLNGTWEENTDKEYGATLEVKGKKFTLTEYPSFEWAEARVQGRSGHRQEWKNFLPLEHRESSDPTSLVGFDPERLTYIEAFDTKLAVGSIIRGFAGVVELKPDDIKNFRNRSIIKGTYSISDDKIELVFPGGPIEVYPFSRTENTLTIADIRFTRRTSKQSSAANKKSAGASSWAQFKAANSSITMWSYTDEIENILEKYYKPAHPRVSIIKTNSAPFFPEAKIINYSFTPTDQFENRLDPVLASGRGAPDVFTLESAFVRKYVESGQLLDLTDIYERNKSKLLAYPVEVGTYNGKVYALSWLACPGAMFYRRSLARKYLGTDDPAVVQTYFANIDKFLETAELLRSKSNGSCVVVSSRGDLQIPFYSARSQPWIVNNRLVIDPLMDQFFEICKTLHDNRLEGRVGQWSNGWFAGIKGELWGNGKRLETFSYFLPTWGLHYVLKTNAPRTSGDWAMIPGPVPYHWGGTWLGAFKNASNAAAAKQMIEWIATDDDFMKQYALATGDMVTNTNAINSIQDSRYSEPFLGGQNHYAEFAGIAKNNVNGRLRQSTDGKIEGLFSEAVNAYVNGEKPKAQALADFRQEVEKQLGLK
jgi:ABC-type glycerol-3-phosphate transport system substrate-binding protein